MSFKKKLEKFHRWQRDPEYFSSKNYDNFLLYVLAIVIPFGITHLINKRQAKAAKD